MSSARDWGFLTLRVLLASPMIALHGWGKVQTLFAEGPVRFAYPLHLGATTTLVLAVLTELVAPLVVFDAFDDQRTGQLFMDRGEGHPVELAALPRWSAPMARELLSRIAAAR